MQATTQYFVKRIFLKHVLDFYRLSKFYARHLGVKIICIPASRIVVDDRGLCDPQEERLRYLYKYSHC
jgi:hypothetical protein